MATQGRKKNANRKAVVNGTEPVRKMSGKSLAANICVFVLCNLQLAVLVDEYLIRWYISFIRPVQGKPTRTIPDIAGAETIKQQKANRIRRYCSTTYHNKEAKT